MIEMAWRKWEKFNSKKTTLALRSWLVARHFFQFSHVAAAMCAAIFGILKP